MRMGLVRMSMDDLSLLEKTVKMVPFKGMFPQHFFQQIRVLLGRIGNGLLPVLTGVRSDGNGVGQGEVVAVLPATEGKKDKKRRPGEQGEDIGRLGYIGVMAEEADAHLALIDAPDDIAGHGDDPPGLEKTDAIDGGKG